MDMEASSDELLLTLLFRMQKLPNIEKKPTEKWNTALIIDFATALLDRDGFVYKETREQKFPLGAPLRTDAGL